MNPRQLHGGSGGIPPMKRREIFHPFGVRSTLGMCHNSRIIGVAPPNRLCRLQRCCHLPLQTVDLMFNAQPEAPAGSVFRRFFAGASGWALNETGTTCRFEIKSTVCLGRSSRGSGRTRGGRIHDLTAKTSPRPSPSRGRGRYHSYSCRIKPRSGGGHLKCQSLPRRRKQNHRVESIVITRCGARRQMR